MDKENTKENSKYNTHLGELFVNCLKEHPDTIHQADAFTGEKETNASFLARSVRLAASLRKYGLKPGDVLALAGPNHINIHVPFFAATYIGLPILGVDPTFKYDEIHTLFKIANPKIVFCQSNTQEYMKEVNKVMGNNYKIITFDGEYNMNSFMEEYEDEKESVDSFRVTNIDTNSIYCWLVSTSGTTGTPKLAAFTHALITEAFQYFLNKMTILTVPNQQTLLNLSPLQWISSYFNCTMTPAINITRLQTSGPNTTEHVVEIINKHKPTTMMCGATLVLGLLKYPGECDLSCFKMITVGGSKVPPNELRKFKARAIVTETYGQTEVLGPPFTPDPRSPIGSVGKPGKRHQVKLIDQETDEIINEPNKMGHLYVKGPCFSGYYKNPQATAEAFTEDGWFKTGDIFYRDVNDYYYFVERTKMLIKFKRYHILPPELEDVIKEHEGVQEVVIVGIPHEEFVEVPAACVVRNPGAEVTAQEIKDIIANKFSDAKRLRGGVIFMDKLIYTSTDKIARHKLREFAKTAHRE